MFGSVHPRLKACYLIRSDARSIDARARALAVEQSVEMPVAAIEDAFVRAEIVGEVEAIAEQEKGLFEVRIALAQETVAGIPANSSTCCSATARCTRMSCCTTSSFRHASRSRSAVQAMVSMLCASGSVRATGL